MEQFWHQGDRRILRIWSGIKRRRQEETNAYSITAANLTANVVAFLRSFGDSNTELPTRDDYLPFRFIDPNSPKEQLRRKLKPSTLECFARLIKDEMMPPWVKKTINGIEGMIELIEASASD